MWIFRRPDYVVISVGERCGPFLLLVVEAVTKHFNVNWLQLNSVQLRRLQLVSPHGGGAFFEPG